VNPQAHISKANCVKTAATRKRFYQDRFIILHKDNAECDLLGTKWFCGQSCLESQELYFKSANTFSHN